MSIEIRPANLETDRDCLIETLGKWLTPRSDRRRYDWLYLGSPAGPARAWLAVSTTDRSIAGAAAAFPRRLSAGEEEVNGYVYGDFCIAAQHRSLGLALRLQRACFENLDNGSVAVAYDFPSASMMAIYSRLKCERRAKFVRMARPLRAARNLERRLPVKAAARAAGAAVDAVLSSRERSVATTSSWNITPHDGPCGDEFSELDCDASSALEIRVARTAIYLNWRYLGHPFSRHEILTARRNGRLEGYLVFCRDGDDARIVDLFGRNAPEMFAALIASACQLLRKRGAATVSAPVLASHSHVAIFQNAGFRPRDAGNVVFINGAAIPAAFTATDSNWFLMDGDRDS